MQQIFLDFNRKLSKKINKSTSGIARGVDGWISTPPFSKKFGPNKKLFKIARGFELKNFFSTLLQNFWLRRCYLHGVGYVGYPGSPRNHNPTK